LALSSAISFYSENGNAKVSETLLIWKLPSLLLCNRGLGVQSWEEVAHHFHFMVSCINFLAIKALNWSICIQQL